jgi:tRNA pseudouridine55 synthase
MGTLDPQGEGVLLVGVGKATRLFDTLLQKDKIYRAHFTFGYETDTLDGDGKVVLETDVIPSKQEVLSVLENFVGECDQLPPAYSAKNINGVRAYDLARKGIEFELKPSRVNIYSLKLLSQDSDNTFYFEIHCSAGTYIRSICPDVAYALGSLATMTSITRIKTGKFKIEDSVTMEQFLQMGESAVVPLEVALSDFARVDIDEQYYEKLCNGVKLDFTTALPSPFTVYCKNELFGLGEVVDGRLKIKPYLRD